MTRARLGEQGISAVAGGKPEALAVSAPVTVPRRGHAVNGADEHSLAPGPSGV